MGSVAYTLPTGRILTLRKAQPQDGAAIVAYLQAVGGESDNLLFGAEGPGYTIPMQEMFLEALERPGSTSATYLGFVDGALIAMGEIAGAARLRLRHTCSLGMTVRKDYWRQGIGEILLGTLIDFARQTGTLQVIHLRVRGDNLGAIALYEKLGFLRVGCHLREMQVDGQYADLMLMDLHLS